MTSKVIKILEETCNVVIYDYPEDEDENRSIVEKHMASNTILIRSGSLVHTPVDVTPCVTL